MPDKVVNIDGALTLEGTRDRCVVEQNKGFRLTAIANATISSGGVALMVNKSEYLSDLSFFPELDFIEPGPDNPETLKTQKKAQGWTFVCSGAIFVENAITNVMVFGR